MLNNNGLTTVSLPVKSRIRADKTFALEKSPIKKKIGRIKKSVFEKITRETAKLFSVKE